MLQWDCTDFIRFINTYQREGLADRMYIQCNCLDRSSHCIVIVVIEFKAELQAPKRPFKNIPQ